MNDHPNPVDVSRKALELAASHGLGARRQAKAKAEEADKNGDENAKAFWLAVASELSSHCSI
jgi:hypothetical protein